MDIDKNENHFLTLVKNFEAANEADQPTKLSMLLSSKVQLQQMQQLTMLLSQNLVMKKGS